MAPPLSAAEAASLWVSLGSAKHSSGPVVAFFKGVMGGMYLSLGGLVALHLTGATGSSVWNGLVFAAVFPFGLISIVLMGVDLCTSNQCIMPMAWFKGKIPLWGIFTNWTAVFLGNLCGSLFVAAVLGKASGVFSDEVYLEYVIHFAEKKVNHPSWVEILVRGIGCNFLVCTATFFGHLPKDVISKVAAIWFPVFFFVSLSFDHVIANQLFIPLGIMLGADIPVGRYIGKSMVAAFIGNALGALLLAIPLLGFYCDVVPELPRWVRGGGGRDKEDSEGRTTPKFEGMNGGAGTRFGRKDRLSALLREKAGGESEMSTVVDCKAVSAESKTLSV